MGQSLSSKKKVAVLGAGKMGSILLQSLLRDGSLSAGTDLGYGGACGTGADAEGQVEGACGDDNSEAVKDADIIFLCVKPQVVAGRGAGDSLATLNAKQLVISIAASVPTEMIERALEIEVAGGAGDAEYSLRAGRGHDGTVQRGSSRRKQHSGLATKFFDSVGRTVVVDEKHMDAVTGLSASGPAYIYIILESLAEAGVKVGLPRDVATLLAAQTTMGAARVVWRRGITRRC